MQDQPTNDSKSREPQEVSLNFEQQRSIVQRLKEGLHLRNVGISAALVLMALVLYLVFFWLPDSVRQPELEVDAKQFMAKEASKPIETSPWRENQLAKYRRDAQEILAKVIEKQTLLEQRKIHLWAQAAYDAAMESAQAGDLSYRSQEFTEAMSLYNQALTRLVAIEQTIPLQYEQTLAKGLKALSDNNASGAKEHLQLAMYIQPDDTRASSAFDRALVLDQVLALIKESAVLREEQEYELAQAKLVQAQELDQQSELVAEQLNSLNQQIKDRDFSIAMSTGYKWLNEKKYQKAIDSFKKARAIVPSSSSAEDAIKQSQNEQLQAKVTLLMQQASSHVKKEQWQQATQVYDKVLKLDKSLVKAQVGLLTAKARLALDKEISYYLDQPNRLASQAVYQKASLVKLEASKIPVPGQRLVKQINALDSLLAQMKVPLNVTIKSDNQTQVTLNRKGHLGQFLAKEITLTPGEYTLIGSRDGFRDVRRQFTLVPSGEHQTIVIQCDERVNRG